MKGHESRSVYVKSKRARRGSNVQKLRRSQRNTSTIVKIKREELPSQEQSTQEPTPPCSPRHTYVYRSPAPPKRNITTAVNQRSDKLEAKYTGSVPCPNQGPENSNQSQEPKECASIEMEQVQQPTVNWDCVSYVISDQKVQTSYEKPEMSPPEMDSDGNPVSTSGRVQAYGKMVTKTVTMTVTTTIATTEILRPGEKGYEESLERQQRQREQGPEEKQKQEKQYHESRKWANGDRTMHENFHFTHHRAAQPAPSTSM